MIKTKKILINIFNSKKVGHQLTDQELKALQNHLMKMYHDIEIVCNRHNIKICLAYGNVLGAIRHNGWIPWDDDLDIHMSREDYDLFLSEYYKELPSQYKVSSYLNDDGSIARFAKIIDTSTVFVPIAGERNEYSGVFVDIFPIDNIGPNRIINVMKKYFTFFMMYTATSVMQVEEDSAIYKNLMFSTKAGKLNWYFRQLWGKIFSFVDYKAWHACIERFWRINRQTGFVHVKPVLTMCGSKLKGDLFYPFKKIKTSIGEVYVPNDTEKYLEICFGNWKRIPDDIDKGHHFVSEISIPG